MFALWLLVWVGGLHYAAYIQWLATTNKMLLVTERGLISGGPSDRFKKKASAKLVSITVHTST